MKKATRARKKSRSKKKQEQFEGRKRGRLALAADGCEHEGVE